MIKVAVMFMFCFQAATLFATEVRVIADRNGKRVEFPVAAVDGIYAWSEAEKTELIDRLTVVESGTTPAKVPIVMDITPEEYEVNFSTIVTDIKSRSEFIKLNTRAGLLSLGKTIKAEYDVADAIGDLTEKERLRQIFLWLKSYYVTLP